MTPALGAIKNHGLGQYSEGVFSSFETYIGKLLCKSNYIGILLSSVYFVVGKTDGI